ncbi:MAG: hypothetical protein F6K23_15130 [Okeania sp. SIO2C9]|uniref:hypothetical protein n=1 Tax=Okeania sp. SIO2C9 TaxID=2607791 RepID=UPI0013C03BF2|nr:hypothetical protein [Okeania sp. SIO2C9]NEQ74253.1 hypothetical protein [Okeania sp. SIO2C9]
MKILTFVTIACEKLILFSDINRLKPISVNAFIFNQQALINNYIKSGSIGVIRWGDGEMGRWGDGEMGRWGDGEMGSERNIW